MRRTLIFFLILFAAGCSEIVTKPMNSTNLKPDFYLYGGDGDQQFLRVIRSCWMRGSLEANGRTILLVEIVPSAIGRGNVNMIGLSSKSSIPILTGLQGDGVTDAIVYEIHEGASDGTRIGPSIGIGAVWKNKPKLRPDGSVIWKGKITDGGG